MCVCAKKMIKQPNAKRTGVNHDDTVTGGNTEISLTTAIAWLTWTTGKDLDGSDDDLS